MPKNIVLLGAGFSRNWGGWLASELTGELLSRLIGVFDEETRALVQHRLLEKGFETVLLDLDPKRRPHYRSANANEHFVQFQKAVRDSFNAMNMHFAYRRGLDFIPDLRFSVEKFLDRFDAIFSLNQDMLLERNYRHFAPTPWEPRWRAVEYPGVKEMRLSEEDQTSTALKPVQWFGHYNRDGNYSWEPGHQPIFKLHGSAHWQRPGEPALMIVGGEKRASIEQEPLLTWYGQKFDEYLNEGNTRLMVIGYSFNDDHINQSIRMAKVTGLQLYLVDPIGHKVLAPPRGDWPPDLDMRNMPLIGISTRPLSSTFGGDALEHSRLMRFFNNEQ